MSAEECQPVTAKSSTIYDGLLKMYKPVANSALARFALL